ncbi:phosphomannomutase/phosphoglucomutase [Marinicella litoralis]|uniref:phosphomannomutase n=1 Tax=Marinicella litoralis TaxID=644220 RepID=A0A4R6XWD4_9GAMM|nr:phosphomannomutase/phosphoglucomutase [Marinicella litoralis]TDR22750.1 phosphomannomutase/phosphoglucomutase [Marinicella litoralis]
MDIKKLLEKMNFSKKDKTDEVDSDAETSITKKLKPLVKFEDEVFWTSAFLTSLLLLLFFAYIMKNNWVETRALSQLTDQSEDLVAAVTKNVNDVYQLAAQTIKDNPDDEQLAQKLKEQLGTALRVLRITEPVDNIEPEPNFPGINFATLDMIKITSATQQEQLPEIHLYGHKDQYLNYVYIQKPEQSYIVISYPVDLIVKKQKLQFENSELSLVQKAGAWSSVVLQKWGHVDPSSSRDAKEIKIPNSNFYVNYSVEKSYTGLFSMTLLSSIIATFSALILTIATFINRKAKIEELTAIKIKQQEEEPVFVPTSKMNKGEASEDNEKGHKKLGHQNSIDEPSGKMKLPDRTIFKAYDIRGIVDETLTTDAVIQIGQAIGTENLNRGRPSIVVARDGRLSGPTLLKALIQGIQQSGCDVINIGAVPTGVLYFSTHHLETGSGVMLTGSHNPPNYNGLKIMLDGETLAGKLISNLYDMIADGNLKSGEGSVQELDIADDYIDYISSEIQLENEPTVVVDCGNGIPGIIAPELLEEIGCNVIPLHCDVDGHFPNHHPDPSVPENLQDLIATLKSVDADIGIAFDGDGDRLGVVTKSGEIINPDRLLMLFAKDVLSRQPGSSIIFDVKCTGHLPKSIVKNGGMPIMWKTGHSFMKAKLKETNAALAGEMSGHFFFNERWFGFDDGIYAAARLLEILDQEKGTPQEVFDTLPNSVNTPELKVHMKEGEHYLFMDEFISIAEFPDAKITTIDGIRADFAYGWGLVRCSNTTPCLVIRFDADDEASLERIKEEFRKQLLAVSDTLELPF